MQVLVRAGDGYAARCVGLRDRLAAAWHADEIDRRLADGASPESDVTTAVRAHTLTSRHTRRQLARALDRALVNATTPAVAGGRAARIASAGVSEVGAELAELRTRLLTRDLTSVRGVARTRLLLVEGDSPVHDMRHATGLRASVRRALDDFDAPAESA